MNVDVAIVGAGPAGLCLARALSGHGLSVALIEQQAAEALYSPGFDGREIALTQASKAELMRLGIWQGLAPEEVSALRDARVFNGPSDFSLDIEAHQAGELQLGYLVPNHAIRREAFAAAMACPDVRLLESCTLREVQQQDGAVELSLSTGVSLRARLLVAADSRFSDTRRRLGIGAKMKDFGKTMLVCRMQHERDHEHVAWEWFGYGQTLAMLPLNGGQASLVLTLPQHEIARLMALDEASFSAEMRTRIDSRLGAMELVSSRHSYPLVGVFPDRLYSQRAALVGDAAVGMHPVTAHGFNFGLQSQRRLADLVIKAQQQGADIGASHLLQSYDRNQRLASWPLYQATNWVVGLYTNDHLAVRVLRNATLRVAQRLSPLRRVIAKHLSQPPVMR